MDGNRRYAKRLNEKVFEGHKKGFKALEETLRVCYELGVKVVTVYAFSIENFKRSQDEVDQLMDLLVDKMDYILKSDLIQKHGVRIKIIGDISLLPPHVQKACAKISLESENNSNAVLNIALAYTSRHEITNAIKQLVVGVEENQLKPDDINESLFEYCLYTDSQPDILIRTSGETRLSDFLLWQSSFSCLLFFKVLWPEFSNWHMFLSVLFYQREYENIQKKRMWYQEQLMQFEKVKIPNELSRNERVESFKLKKKQEGS